MCPSIHIVLINYNGLEDTVRCLESIAEIEYPALSTIVVDNASAIDPSAELRLRFPWCRILRSESNEGWAGGNNLGIRAALESGADHVVLLNNDTTVAERLIARLTEAAQLHRDFGIIGPIINDMSEPDRVQTDGCTFNMAGDGFFQRRLVPISTAGPPQITEVDIVNGCCMMIARPVFEAIGVVDERFFLVHEESDFCLRARQAGFRCGVIGEPLVWHKHSSSFERAGKRIQRYYDVRNLYLLLRKHLGAQGPGRAPWRSWLAYLKYAYYWYSHEREHGKDDAAAAVVEGICDAIAGRYGHWTERRRWLLRPLRGCFELTWRWNGGKRLAHVADASAESGKRVVAS